jgi:hypothetical protein
MLIILVFTNHMTFLAVYFSIIIVVNGYYLENFIYFKALFKFRN